jgi:hypothetical protein
MSRSTLEKRVTELEKQVQALLGITLRTVVPRIGAAREGRSLGMI